MDRMLTPHRAPRIEPIEHPRGARARAQPGEGGIRRRIERDYDPSLPELSAIASS